LAVTLTILNYHMSLFNPRYSQCCHRAIAQAVGRRLPTAAARVRSHIRLCGIYGGQSVTEAVFLPVLRFSLPILIPINASHLLIILSLTQYSLKISGVKQTISRSQWPHGLR
jgi:hypothetical protein